MQFVTAHAVLTVGNHPHGREPLAQRDRAVFHDRADFDCELTAVFVARVALPAALIF